MSKQGWNSLTIHMQHGLVNLSTSISMLQAINTSNVFPIACVPWLEVGIIIKMLDVGAKGIICLMINERSQAQRFVYSCYYPHNVSRSVGLIEHWYKKDLVSLRAKLQYYTFCYDRNNLSSK